MPGKAAARAEDGQARTGEDGIVVTQAGLRAYLDALRAKGLAQTTCRQYAAALRAFYRELSPDKRADGETLERWREQMLAQGYAQGTINLSLSTASRFLQWLGRREFRPQQVRSPGEPLSELSRDEYLRLLQAARHRGKERSYLLIKLFASTGITIQALQELTVENLREDGGVTVGGDGRRRLHIPGCVRRELLDYAARAGIASGLVFRTRNGKPMLRSQINGCVHALCREAGVEDGKGNPRCLQQLYWRTRRGIEANLELLVEQAHDRMLEEEQRSFGWEAAEEGI